MSGRVLGLVFALFVVGLGVCICGCDLLKESICPPCPPCECGIEECIDMVGDRFDGDD